MSADYFAAMRAAVDEAQPDDLLLYQVTQRKCQHCGHALMLMRGRHSGKWAWSHAGLTSCQFDAGQCSVRFGTEAEAREATEIFKAQNQRGTNENKDNQESATGKV